MSVSVELLLWPTSISACRGVGAGFTRPWEPCFGLTHAIRTATPVDDLGLVYLVTLAVHRRETGRESDCAVHVDGAAADATDQMVVVVADAGLEARG